jgi:hypothetical protein
VPVGDVSDRLIDELLSRAVEHDHEAVASMIRDAYGKDASEALVRKLRAREKSIALEAVPTLLAEISVSASAIPVSRDLLSSEFVIGQAAAVVVNMAARLDPADEDASLVSSLERTDSLLFAAHVIGESQAEKRVSRGRPPLPPERINPLSSILFRRVKDAAAVSNLFDATGERLGRILFTIYHFGSQETIDELKEYLQTELAADPTYGVRFIKALSGRSQGGDGIIRVSDVTRETYNAIGELLQPDRIYEALLSQFGKEIAHSEWQEADDRADDSDRRIADQFAYLHLHPSLPADISKSE